MSSFFILGILLLPSIIFLNVVLFHMQIKRAIKRVVKPALEKSQLTYVGYKWAGFWSCGDFKNDSMDFALFKTGLNTTSIYSYLYYKDSDVNKKITIKIYLIGFEIDKVEYSGKF